MADKKIIGLCGSLRQDSFNRKLLLEAVRLYGKCNFTEADLRLPLYNGDDEKVEKPISVLKEVLPSKRPLIFVTRVVTKL